MTYDELIAQLAGEVINPTSRDVTVRPSDAETVSVRAQIEPGRFAVLTVSRRVWLTAVLAAANAQMEVEAAWWADEPDQTR